VDETSHTICVADGWQCELKVELAKPKKEQKEAHCWLREGSLLNSNMSRDAQNMPDEILDFFPPFINQGFKAFGGFFIEKYFVVNI
jgi:hypothetical protein